MIFSKKKKYNLEKFVLFARNELQETGVVPYLEYKSIKNV